MEVDPQFRGAAQRSKARRRRRLAWRGGIVLGAVSFAAGGWLLWRGLPVDGGPAIADDAFMVQSEDTASLAAPRVETPFVDIAGDPMILRFEVGGEETSRALSGPAALDAVRIGPVTADRLTLITDDLIVASRELMTALPSSREDFAFFQSQRSASLQPEATTAPTLLPDGEAPRGVEVTVEADDSSWGQSLSGDPDATVTYVETAVENTTSIVFVKPEAQRARVYGDAVLAIDRPRPLGEVLAERGLPEAEVTALVGAVAALRPGAETLAAGGIVALRTRPDAQAGAEQVLHLSVYGPDGYLASVVRTGAARYGEGPNLWIDKDLPRLARGDGGGGPQVPAGQEYRLLDGFYSAAIRNGVPSNLVGEAIVLMSQAHDMDAIADPKDRMTLLYAPAAQPGAAGPAQILYAAIDGPSGKRDCYVVPDDGPAGYACFRSQGGVASGGGGALGGGLMQPVAGTLTSKFGPRFHPILKVPKLHAGVDWAAPTGTPIVAAAAGTVTKAGDGSGYGNVVYIDHPTGMQTRYAHLDAFAPGLAAGQQIPQGQLIGYVGTTGRSTGPHLHFEVHIGGQPVDPMNLPSGGGGGGGVMVASAPAGPVDPAVETLVNRIIQVESGGNAAAKNPLSTATGLGQFIESTWLRMMRDYRPDLAANMDRAALLALRTDPTLSREMVTNLARENESYLRGRGHQITAGRLYLAHFLGPAGADTVLAATDTAMIRDVMGGGVVGANPFLANYSVADLKAWADRKMGQGGNVVSAPPPPVVIPEAVKVYMSLIDEMVAATG